MRDSLLFMLAVLTFGACVDQPPERPDATGLVVERGGEFGGEGDEGLLSSVFDIDVSEEGEVFASEPEYAHVLAYRPDGSFRRVIGGRGEGPGEMQIPGALWMKADTLIVMDFRLGAQFFGPDGTFYDRVDVHLPPQQDALLPTRPLFPLSDGSFGATSPATSDLVTRGVVTHQVWVKVTREGAVLDTLFLQPLEGRLVRLDFGGGRPHRSTSHPLPWDVLLAVPPDGSFVLAVDRTPAPEARTFAVRRLSVDGDTIATREISYEPHPLSSADIDSISAVRGARLEGRGITASQATQVVREQVPWPASTPPVTVALAASDGTVWLRREEVSPDSVRWDALSAEMNDLGSFYLPTEFDAKVVVPQPGSGSGWSIYGIELDALDVPTIVQYLVTPSRLPAVPQDAY